MTTKALPLLATLLAAALPLSACAGEESAAPSETQTAANGETFNDADVEFATDMVQHHAQALQMVDLTLGRKLTPEVAGLADQVRATQGPEIETMTDWLTAWDQPVPETSRDHAHAHGGAEADVDEDMPGMMSPEEMAELEKASGRAFQDQWLEMMVEHHEGAIEMAQDEQAEGANADAVALAKEIESAQQSEISTMEDLLAGGQ